MTDNSLRILLVEDNPGDVRLIEEMLRGTTVRLPPFDGSGEEEAESEISALTLLHADRLEEGLRQLDETIDIVLLDLGLPDSAGLDTLRTVLERPTEVPIVVLTGLTDETIGVQAVQQGAQSYLIKDEIDSELLVRSLRYAFERHQRETQLTALSAISRELMAATTEDDIAEIAVEAATDALDLPVAVVCLYDTDLGKLRPHAATVRAEDLLLTEETAGETAGIATQLTPTCAEVVGRVFATSEAVIDTAGDTQSERTGADTPLRNRIVLPLATRGVFLAGTTTAATIPSTGIDYARILATNVQAALERLDRDRQLREREAALEAQTETLERLDRINAVVRDILQGVVHATTRTEIERAVCERLAAADPIRFAWIGEYDPLTRTLAPRAHAGVEDGYLDDISIAIDDDSADENPVRAAVRTRELQVIEDAVQDLPSAPRREAALKRGYRAIASIPLVYADTLYGVITVYSDQPGIFDDQEQSLLNELGETIAHAINAVESKKALISDRVVELEFRLGGREIVFLDLTAEIDCELAFESVIPRQDDRLRMFFTTRGATVEAVIAFAERSPAIEAFALVAERDDDCVFECTLREPNLLSFCLEHGVSLQTLTADAGTGRAIVELSSDANVRGFVEQFQTTYPETTLVASREDERSVQTRQAFQATLDDRLTDRQAEVLRTAFFSGYFDSPRASSGRDVAATLDITQPTFSHHLRTALRKLLTHLYAE